MFNIRHNLKCQFACLIVTLGWFFLQFDEDEILSVDKMLGRVKKPKSYIEEKNKEKNTIEKKNS